MATQYERDDTICGDDPSQYDPNRSLRPQRRWGVSPAEAGRVIVVALAGLNPDDEDQSFNILTGATVLDAIRAHPCPHLVLDLRRVAMVSTGHPDWIQNTFGETVGKVGIRRVAVILPGNVYGFLVTGMPTPEGYWLNVKGAKAPVPVNYFDAEAPALAWLEAE
jgi:hypothetical protein